MKIKRAGVFSEPKRILACSCLLILLFAQPTATASGDVDSGDRDLPTIQLRIDQAAVDQGQAPVDQAACGQAALTGDEVKTNLTNYGDYVIETGATGSRVAVLAIHGGKIEPGTGELAYALSSRNDFNYYAYKGIKSKGNAALHISSDQFAEPAALAMVAKSEVTLSIHGCAGSKEFTYIGGLDTELADKIRDSLTRYGFTVLDAPRNLAGRSPHNIANKNSCGRGVQLEISKGLRAQFLATDSEPLQRYAAALSEAVGSMQ